MSIAALVVDDEPIARHAIVRLLREDADVEVLGECGDGASALAAIRQHSPDLVFLDIQMPAMNGIDVVAAIGAERMPATVFVTAYEQYAVRAFEANAVDYLVKPFSRERFLATLRRVKARLSADAVAFDAALARGMRLPPVQRDVHADDLALMSYTGGTTGVSKAVRTTHANMRAGIEILRLTMEEHTCRAGGLVASVHPFSHAAGMSVNLLQYSSRGVTQLLFPRMIDAERVVAGWRGRPINSILAGPAFHNRLMATPGFAELDFSALRSGLVGGMPLRADIRDRFEQITGKPLLQGYGLTETSVPIAGELGFERRLGSVGFPFPSVEVTMRDPDAPDLGAVAPGRIGEVWLRGPFMMAGYDQRPDENARAITADGWFRTGDLGRMEPDGALYLLGRIKDMINVDGANVYPAAIEDVVGAHPGIADVCAVGMPDEEDGERVRLFIVRRDPSLDEDAVRAWCLEKLSHFKQPKRVEFLDALPRSAVDKLLRRELAERPL